MDRFRSAKDKVEFERMVELARKGKLSHLPKEIVRAWVKARLRVDISERHLRRVVNQTKS